MKLRRRIRQWLSIETAIRYPTISNIEKMRKLHRIILSAEQIASIMISVERQAGCRLLVFGLGNDSAFWRRLNRKGMTLFLEDHEGWFQKVMGRFKKLNAFLIQYNTQIGDWQRLLEDESKLEMHLPQEVRESTWHTILVDAPAGSNAQAVGRMKSIYAASQLAGSGCDVFVHDCEREVEDAYCNRYLQAVNLQDEIESPVGVLRKYRMN